jgi:hypothetical protein
MYAPNVNRACPGEIDAKWDAIRFGRHTPERLIWVAPVSITAPPARL